MIDQNTALASQTDGAALDGLIPAILRSVDATLETKLSGEMQTAEAKTLLDIIRSLLFWSIQRIETGTNLYRDREASIHAAIGTGRSVAVDSPPPLLQTLLDGEADFYAGFDPESIHDPATAYLGGKSLGRPSFAAKEPPLDGATITRYLQNRLPQFPDLAVSDVTVLTGGMSKDTILFTLSGTGCLDGGVVLRKDFVQRGSDLSAIDEYPLLEAVFRAGLPVAEPLWAEKDSAALGAPFIVVRRVPGHAAVGESFADAEVKRHFVDRLAETLSRIHALSPVEIGIYGDRARLPVAELTRGQVAQWQDFWRRSQLERDVTMDFLFEWMAANVPSEPAYGPAIVHGDYGFHNLLTKDGEVTAILDWEFSHLGDPMEDIGFARQFIEPLGLWTEFLSDYQRYGGVAFDEERSHYFTIWQNVRNACLCAGALNAFHRGQPGNLRMGAAGISLLPRFKLAALRQITEVQGSRRVPA